MPNQPPTIRHTDEAKLDRVKVALVPRKRKRRGFLVCHDRCELIGKPVPIERTQILLKSKREVSRPNRIAFQNRCIERHVVSENQANAWRWGNIAKMRFAEFAEPPTDIEVFTAIPDALKLGGPGSAKHAVEFFFACRLALDETVVLAVVSEKARGFDEGDIAGSAATIDHVKGAGSVLRMWPDGISHRCLCCITLKLCCVGGVG
jgi:hypothetical protein